MKCRKNERGYTLIELMITLMFPLVLIIGIATLYVGGSTIVSGIKAGTDNCGVTYPVEAVFQGDWFCAEAKEGINP